MDNLSQANLLKYKYAALCQRINANYRHHQDGKPRIRSQSTLSEYEKVSKRIRENHPSTEAIIRYFQQPGHKVSINTWRKERAALIWRNDLGLEQKIEDINPAHTEKDILTIESYCDSLENLLDLTPPPLSQRKKKISKRKLIGPLRKIYPNWRIDIISKMPTYQAPLLILALTGCRPAELVLGVKAELIDEKIRLEISGVKVTHYSGQEKRGFEIAVDGILANNLAMLLRKNKNILFIKIASARNLSRAIGRAGKRVFPKLQGNVTAYCFRHQFAADLKFISRGNEDDQIKISMMLGHQAEHTKQYYGYSQHGSGGSKFPENIYATNQVRTKGNPVFQKRRSPRP